MLTDPTTKLPDLALSDKETILAFGSKDDAEKVWAVMKDQQTPVPGVVIEASATVIKVAVTQDAKDAKVPDFIVTLKTPLADKDIPAVGFEYGLSAKGQAELDGTYDSYTQIPAKDAVPASGTTPATSATAQSAQIASATDSSRLKRRRRFRFTNRQPPTNRQQRTKAAANNPWEQEGQPAQAALLVSRASICEGAHSLKERARCVKGHNFSCAIRQ
jgi:hypothetical protein